MKTKKIYKSLALLIILTIVLAACAPEDVTGSNLNASSNDVTNDTGNNSPDNAGTNDTGNDSSNSDQDADDADDQDTYTLTGTVEDATDTSITVDGETYDVNLAEFGLNPDDLIGLTVSIEYSIDDDYNLVVHSVELVDDEDVDGEDSSDDTGDDDSDDDSDDDNDNNNDNDDNNDNDNNDNNNDND